MIEQCRCGGAICAHGTCTRCSYCEHCGPGGREYYEDRLYDALEQNGSEAGHDAYRGVFDNDEAEP